MAEDLGPYHVYYDSDEWKVERANASRPSATSDTKSDAERQAVALASRRNETVVVHNKNNRGKVEFKPR